MNSKRIMFEIVIGFAIIILTLNFIVAYQDNVIQKQRVVIKEMLQHCEGK